jgi:hypothetical protein
MIVVTLSTGYDFSDIRSMYYIFGATQNDIQNPIFFFPKHVTVQRIHSIIFLFWEYLVLVCKN